MRWVGHRAFMGYMRNAHNILIRKPEAKRPLGGPRQWCKIILRWILLVDWIHLTQGRDKWQALVNRVTFGLHKRWGNAWAAGWLSTPQQGFSSLKSMTTLHFSWEIIYGFLLYTEQEPLPFNSAPSHRARKLAFFTDMAVIGTELWPWATEVTCQWRWVRNHVVSIWSVSTFHRYLLHQFSFKPV
jgi:hypothetical protein